MALVEIDIAHCIFDLAGSIRRSTEPESRTEATKYLKSTTNFQLNQAGSRKDAFWRSNKSPEISLGVNRKGEEFCRDCRLMEVTET